MIASTRRLDLTSIIAQDIATLCLLTHAPHLLLLFTYYEIALPALVFLFAINTIATYLPFRLLRAPAAHHVHTTPDAVAGDNSIRAMTTLVATLFYALPYIGLTITGVLPLFLATHFSGLKTLEVAHASTLPGVAALLLPLGFAATLFFFVPTAHSLASAEDTVYMMEFDPVSATLGQTLHRNILWHLYLPARTQELSKRVLSAAVVTMGYTAFWAFVEIEGVELVGALGWASVWTLGALLAGGGLAWIGGVAH